MISFSENRSSQHIRSAVLFTLLTSGCTTIHIPEVTFPSLELPYLQSETRYLNAQVENVPFFPQEELLCGPAALATALAFEGKNIQPADLTKEVFLPGRQGTLQTDMLAGTRRSGLVPYPIGSIPKLQESLRNGKPVLVLLNLSLPVYPQWHYAVVFGYQDGSYLLRSGANKEEVIKDSTFVRLWSRSDNWGFVALPVTTPLPSFVEAQPWIENAVAMEKISATDALQAYSSGMERWADDARYPFAIGNLMLQSDDPAKAVGFFKKAVEIDREYADAWNNLAEAYWASGDRFKAYLAVEEAQAIGGTHLFLYNETEKRFIEEEKKETAKNHSETIDSKN